MHVQAQMGHTTLALTLAYAQPGGDAQRFTTAKFRILLGQNSITQVTPFLKIHGGFGCNADT